MLFSDEHNAQIAGVMGHEMVETPNLDRLAAEGNACCNSPLCSPRPAARSHAAEMYARTSAGKAV